jgi:hypothetical protein
MKINQIVQETTTSGSVAPVEHGFVKMQTRNPSVYGNTKAGNLLKGKKTNKPFANSVNESAELSEADLQEDDIIVLPGQGRTRKTGFTKHGQSRVDHEVEMARSDVLATMKNARVIYELLKNKSEEEGLEGWVQEKLIKANDYLNSVKEYYDEKMMQQESVPPAGVIGNGGMGESRTEVKDKSGKVVSWKDDTEWHKAEKNKKGQEKDPRGVVTHLSDVARRKTEKQDTKEGKIDFAKKIQKNVDKSNKAIVKTKKEVGSRVADIGAGGKEYNVKTDKAWDDAQKTKKAK